MGVACSGFGSAASIEGLSIYIYIYTCIYMYMFKYIYIYIHTKLSSSCKLVQASLQTLKLSCISRRCHKSRHRCITVPPAQGTDVHYATCWAVGGDASSFYIHMHTISNIMMEIQIGIYTIHIYIHHTYFRDVYIIYIYHISLYYLINILAGSDGDTETKGSAASLVPLA